MAEMVKKKLIALIAAVSLMASSGTVAYSGEVESTEKSILDAGVDVIEEQHEENKRITDDNYDKSLAVRCVNGTFVGQKTDNVITYKGIPFVGQQPVGEMLFRMTEYTRRITMLKVPARAKNSALTRVKTACTSTYGKQMRHLKRKSRSWYIFMAVLIQLAERAWICLTAPIL